MNRLIMPMGTAVWLVDNTSLTFEQIAQFVDMHVLEIKAVADGEIGASITGWDPVSNGQLSAAEIKRCEADAEARLVLSKKMSLPEGMRKKTKAYTPIAKRHDKINGIAWLLRNKKGFGEKRIVRLLGASLNMVRTISDGTHWNNANIEARHPVESGVCSRTDYDHAMHAFEKEKSQESVLAPTSLAPTAEKPPEPTAEKSPESVFEPTAEKPPESSQESSQESAPEEPPENPPEEHQEEPQESAPESSSGDETAKI